MPDRLHRWIREHTPKRRALWICDPDIADIARDHGWFVIQCAPFSVWLDAAVKMGGWVQQR